MAQDDSARGQGSVPDAIAAPRRRRVLSVVWIVPVVAALVAGWLAVEALLRQGPTITISFITAEGLEPGITKLKYKDVEIGTVTTLSLAPDRSRVLVTARMHHQASSLLNADTRFWVVRPRVSAKSVTGLGTLFSGAYIGVDVGTSTEEQREFVGLEVPPVLTSGRAGTQYVLRSESLGSLDIGSPVHFRQVQVGEVVAFELDEDGRGISVRIFVNSPFDRFVKPRSRFWVASGIDAAFDASGFRLDTESLVSILVGAIAFRTPADAFEQAPAKSAAVFDLFPDQAAALKQPDTVVQPAVMVFQESVRGLAAGAPIDFRGIQVGEVKSIEFNFDPEQKQALLVVKAEIYPERLRRRPDVAGASTRTEGSLIEAMIRRGLHAQLRQGNLLTGQLYVALEFGAGARPLDQAAQGTDIRIPTAPSSFTEIQTTLANIAKKLEQVPLEDLTRELRSAVRTLDGTLAGVDRLVRTAESDLAPELRHTLTALRKTLESAQVTLESARGTLSSAQSALESDAPVQTELRDMLREVTRSAEAIRNLADTLERHPEALLRGKTEQP